MKCRKAIHDSLTHLPLENMAAISEDDIFKGIFMNAIDLVVGISSGNGLRPNRRQAITWTHADPVHWRIYAASGRDELNIWHRTVYNVILWTRCS